MTRCGGKAIPLGRLVIAVVSGIIVAAQSASACERLYLPLEVRATVYGFVPDNIPSGFPVKVAVYRVTEDPVLSGPTAKRESLAQSASTDGRGRFLLAALPKGYYNLVVAEGTNDEFVVFMRVRSRSGRTSITAELSLRHASSRSERIQQAETNLPRKIGKLVGSVLDSTGAVVPGASVYVTRPDSTDKLAEQLSNNIGGFSFNLPPGLYRLHVERAGFAGVQATFSVEPGEHQPFKNGIGVTLEVLACGSYSRRAPIFPL